MHQKLIFNPNRLPVSHPQKRKTKKEEKEVDRLCENVENVRHVLRTSSLTRSEDKLCGHFEAFECLRDTEVKERRR